MAQTVRQIISGAMRRNGALSSGAQPTAAEIEDTLLAYNNLVRSLHGTLIGTPLTPVSMTAATTAEIGGNYMVAFSSAGATLTLPSNPMNGARVGFADVKANFATYNLTVNPNSRLIEAAASNLTLSTNSTNRVYWFNAEAGNWVREQDAAIGDTCVYPDSVAGYLPDMLAVHCISEFGGEVRPDTVARSLEGRAAFARVFGRQGRNQLYAPMVAQA